MTDVTSAETQRPPSPDNLRQMQEQRMREILDPSHSALLVIDMQEDFVGSNGKASTLWHQDIEPMQRIVPTIQDMVDLFREQGRPVIWTRTFEDPEDRSVAGLDRFIFFEKGDKEGEVACLRGTPGAELVMEPAEGEVIIDKIKGSAFVGTDLEKWLEKNGVKTVMVVGVKTQRCVGSTVKDLYDHGKTHVVVLEDCVGSDSQEQHDATIKELRTFYPPVTTSDVVKKAWAKPKI